MKTSVTFYNGDGSAWDAFVVSHPDSTNYHLYAWRSVIEKTFGHKAFYLTAMNGENEICGVLPLVNIKSLLFGNFLVSLPFFNYGGVLCRNGDAEASLLESAASLLSEIDASHAELRHLRSCERSLPAKQHKVAMILDLEKDEATQWNALDSKVRNQVRKAKKSRLTVISGRMELLDGFYGVFCRNMRDLGTPVYSRNFFRNILDAFPETTRIISVILEDKTIASGIITRFRDSVEAPWASSINDFKHHCPNNLLYWEAIRFAISNGAKKFDFGRSTPGGGTFRFKQRWGAKPVQLYWHYLLEKGKNIPELHPGNPKYRAAIKVWQRLPLGVANLIGPWIVSNIP